MIMSFFRVDYPYKDGSVAGTVSDTGEWKLVES